MANLFTPILIRCLLILLCIGPAKAVRASTPRAEPVRVLVIQSYHHGFAWTENLQRGIESVFKESGIKVEIAAEYMDAKRFPGNSLFGALAELYASKYSRRQPDLIISCDDDALHFLFEYRDRIFPDVPVVFCGLDADDYDPSRFEGRRGYTGVVERLDPAGTIDLILKLHPDVKRIVFIHDRTTSGLAHRRIIEGMAPRYEDRVDFVFPDTGGGLTEDELLSFLRNLQPDSKVYFLGFFRDRLNEPLELETLLPRISETSPVPVYSHAEAFFGYGIVGGKLLRAEIHGRSTATKALRLLRGAPVSRVPVSVESSNRYMFDYRQLRRFSIPESRLPEGCIIAFEPTSFLDRHRAAIAWAIAGVIALIAFTLALLLNIASRRRIEKRLAAGERRYRLLADNARDMIWTMDAKHRYTYVSPSVERLLGYRPEELPDIPFEKRFSSESLVIAKKLMEERENRWRDGVPDDRSYRLELEQLRKDGGSVWTEIVSNPLLDEDGKPLGIVGVTRDISERKAYEAALRESETRFRAVFEAMPLYLALWKVGKGDFILSEVNPATVELSETKIEEWLGTPLSVFYQDSPWLIEAMRRAHSERGIVHMERFYRLRTTSKEVYLKFSFVSVSSDLVLAVAEDITERKQAQAELEKYHRIVSSTPDSIAYIDQEYRYRIANDAYETFSNIKRDKFLGKTVAEYLGEEIFREKIKPHFDRCLKGETIQYQDWFTYPTLGTRFVQVTYFPFRNHENVITGIVANTRDITELKLAEEKIQQYAEHLEEIVAERTQELKKTQEELLIRERLAVLGHFAGSISHELRNPLGAIDASIYYLKMKIGSGDEKISDHLTRVRTNIQRATAIIESLLNLSRMEKPKTRPHAVSRLIPDILRAAKIPEAVGVETVYPSDETYVEVDADQIQMVLKNIFHNAVQAMEGAGTLTVNVQPPEAGRVEIRISDTGPGIPPENIEKVFQPLFSTKTHGIGFGLSIARMIVERHDGALTAESPVDGGARFVVTLPQDRPSRF